MESALRENRMTLEAIKVTQSDRDLFKHLITETTNYVASDYMRNANERRGNIEAALESRREWYKAKAEQNLSQHRLVDLSREVAELAESERTLEVDHQSAVDHLNLVLNALRHQEKNHAPSRRYCRTYRAFRRTKKWWLKMRMMR